MCGIPRVQHTVSSLAGSAASTAVSERTYFQDGEKYNWSQPQTDLKHHRLGRQDSNLNGGAATAAGEGAQDEQEGGGHGRGGKEPDAGEGPQHSTDNMCQTKCEGQNVKDKMCMTTCAGKMS